MRKKEIVTIVMIRTNISETESRKTIEEINETKASSLKSVKLTNH